MKKNNSVIFRVTIMVLAVLIISTAAIGAFSYTLNRSEAISLNADKALAISKSIAAAVDPEQFKEIMQTREKNDHWYTFKAYLDDVYKKNNLLYLYVLDKDYGSEVTYFAEGYDHASIEGDEVDLGETDSIDNYADEMYGTMDTGIESTTDIYVSGEYGSMVSGFAPISDKNGQIVGVVGVDLSVNDVVASSNRFAIFMIVFVAVLSVIMGFVVVWYIKRSVGKPITDLTKAAEKISKGDINIAIQPKHNDEIGMLVDSFNWIVDSTKTQAQALGALSDGDLTIDVRARCENDIMNIAIAKVLGNLNEMFLKINQSTTQVAAGANQIADSSQFLAQGSTEQAAAVEQLSSSITEVASKAKDNADLTLRAASLGDTIRGNAEKGSLQMDQMMQAVKEIGEASQSISKVIKVIDDIAFQTNILALNAAVEAARAGQHGKGFAVVAEEVRRLASKSAEAAKDTGSLIINSIEKAELGARIAGETAESLAEIVSGINENSRIVKDIEKSSEEQTVTINEINRGINQVSQVVQQNSATAEESAAAGKEMSEQANVLEELILQFKLKK